MEPVVQSRRTFNAQALGSLLTFSLLETLCRYDLFADEIRPNAIRWLADVNQLGNDLKGQKLEQLAWQKKVEELLPQVDLPEPAGADRLRPADDESELRRARRAEPAVQLSRRSRACPPS